MTGCCWIAEWCGVADRAKRRALAPNPRSNAVDASSSTTSTDWSCPPHDGGHGRSASSLQRRSRQAKLPNSQRHNESPYPVASTHRLSHGSCCPDSSASYFLFGDAIIRPHPALPKRLQNVLEKRLSFKRPTDPNHIARRKAMSDNFIYGDITR